MMNSPKTGGESRPRRRRVLKLSLLILVAAILLIAIRESDAEVFNNLFDEPDQERLADPDSLYARELLDAVRGANGVLCGAVDRSFDTGYWSHSLSAVIETDFADQRSVDVAMWMGRRKFDASVMRTARAALRSEDACVRRVAARIIGNTRDRENVHEDLRSELSAGDARVRTAALFALGFADSEQALPAIRERLEDSDRNVRIAAIWALASIGDISATNTMVALLERDGDPIVRSAAAWALGRLND